MQQLIDYIARLAAETIATRAAIVALTQQVSSMSAFDPTPIIAQLAAIDARVNAQAETLAALAGQVGGLDTRVTDTVGVVSALAGKVAELQQAGTGDLSGLPAL